MFFKQVQKNGDNFSYILADDTVGEAVAVDTSYNAGEIAGIIKAANCRLKYIISTHGHSDHTAGNEDLKRMLGGQLVAYRSSRMKFDIGVDDGDILQVGQIKIRVIHTPGHTPDSICLLVDDKTLLTGDTLFVGECGRTDLPGGSSRDMFNSLFNKLLKLHDAVLVYPGHDYGSKPYSTIGAERKSNYTLQPRSLEEFIAFMETP